MASKDFGDAVTINWNHTPLPKVGEFYVSARTAYLIGLVRPRNTRDGSDRAHVRAIRIDPDTLPARAKRHDLSWAPRDKVSD